MKWKIIADSGCDYRFLDNLAPDTEFVSVPLTIQVGETIYRDDAQLNIDQMMEEMYATTTASKSACPSPDDYMKSFEGAGLLSDYSISVWSVKLVRQVLLNCFKKPEVKRKPSKLPLMNSSRLVMLEATLRLPTATMTNLSSNSLHWFVKNLPKQASKSFPLLDSVVFMLKKADSLWGMKFKKTLKRDWTRCSVFLKSNDVIR